MTTPSIPDAVVKAGGAAVNKAGWTCQGGEDEPGQYAKCEDCAKVCDNLARAVLAAAWEHLHPVVTTAEELEALGWRAVLLDGEGDPIVCCSTGFGGNLWQAEGREEPRTSDAMVKGGKSYTVLHRGGDVL